MYLCEADVAVLAGVVGHPFELPTLHELEFVAGEFDADLVGRRVQRLVEQDVLEVVRFEGRAPDPDAPATFYGTTTFGETVLQRRLPAARTRRLQAAYARVAKPDAIRQHERAPRPARPADR